MIKIVDKFVKLTEFKLSSKGIKLKVNKAAKELMAKRGYDPKMGARPIKREVDLSITKKLIKPMLKGELTKGKTVKVSVEKDDIKLEFIDTPPPRAKKSLVKEIPSLIIVGDSGGKE